MPRCYYCPSLYTQTTRSNLNVPRFPDRAVYAFGRFVTVPHVVRLSSSQQRGSAIRSSVSFFLPLSSSRVHFNEVAKPASRSTHTKLLRQKYISVKRQFAPLPADAAFAIGVCLGSSCIRDNQRRASSLLRLGPGPCSFASHCQIFLAGHKPGLLPS